MPQHDAPSTTPVADPHTAELWRLAGWATGEDPAHWLRHLGAAAGPERRATRAVLAELEHHRAEVAALRAEAELALTLPEPDGIEDGEPYWTADEPEDVDGPPERISASTVGVTLDGYPAGDVAAMERAALAMLAAARAHRALSAAADRG